MTLKYLTFVVYELIDDIRRRIDKGLRVAEKAVRESVIDTQNVDAIIQRLRRNYRRLYERELWIVKKILSLFFWLKNSMQQLFLQTLES